MDAQLPLAQGVTPGKPMVITETGYVTGVANTYSEIDQAGQAKLLLDTLCDAFMLGVARTYLYELFDDTKAFGYNGLGNLYLNWTTERSGYGPAQFHYNPS